MSHTIPNWLSVTVWLMFLPAAWLAELSGAQIAWNMAFGLVLMSCVYAASGLGAGAAKLLGAIACWIGLNMTFFGFLLVAAGGMSLVFLALKCIGRPASALPFLPYAALGFALALPHTAVWAGLTASVG